MNLNADLVFTDMQMPKRTGLEVIEAILGYPCVRKKPKFVLVTADRDSYLINKSWELGFDIEYKPISAERIHEYINGFEPVKIDTKAEKKKMKEYLKEVREELRKRRKMAK